MTTTLTPENRTVHALWIGDSLSPLEVLTIKSFIACGHEFHLWLYKPLSHPVPDSTVLRDAADIMPESAIFRYKNRNQFGHGKGSLGGFSDVFRYKLLYDEGGWWTDMDVTCLRSLDFSDPYVFRTHQNLPLVGNLMKCPKGSELMKSCYEKAIKEVDENNTDWNKPILILANEVRNFRLETYVREFTNPDMWRLIRTFLIRDKELPEQWHAIHWVNEEWRRNRISRTYFRKKSLLGSLMVRHGIDTSTASFSTDFLYWLNLTWCIASIRQLPWFVQRNLGMR